MEHQVLAVYQELQELVVCQELLVHQELVVLQVQMVLREVVVRVLLTGRLNLVILVIKFYQVLILKWL
jgi:hypothetical protein